MIGHSHQRAGLRPFRPVPFGRYTLLSPLATGGMGEIFLARFEGPNGFEKLCVIKKMLSHLAEDPSFVERFVGEAKTLVKLSHGSIAQVFDMGIIEGEPYIALEHVDGKDLRKVAARQRDRSIPLPLTFVLYVMGRVLDALAYAHRKRDDQDKELGLVHRDVSPQNILVSYEGEVKVIDFGLAKSTLTSAKTNPSIILGKFIYMSPEQARHQKVDRRSDLYAVGLCLYELISGRNPFDGVPPGELMARVANPSIASLLEADPLCPQNVVDAVMKALAVDPARRYQTAEEMRGKLMGALLEIDPSAGPESVSRYMRDAFAADFAQERKQLSALKETKTAPGDEEGAQEQANLDTAVVKLADVAPSAAAAVSLASARVSPSGKKVQVGPIEHVPLSFAPTPRTRETPAATEPRDEHTVPGIEVTIGDQVSSAPPVATPRSLSPSAVRAARDWEAPDSVFDGVPKLTPRHGTPVIPPGGPVLPPPPEDLKVSGDGVTARVEALSPLSAVEPQGAALAPGDGVSGTNPGLPPVIALGPPAGSEPASEPIDRRERTSPGVEVAPELEAEAELVRRREGSGEHTHPGAQLPPEGDADSLAKAAQEGSGEHTNPGIALPPAEVQPESAASATGKLQLATAPVDDSGVEDTSPRVSVPPELRIEDTAPRIVLGTLPPSAQVPALQRADDPRPRSRVSAVRRDVSDAVANASTIREPSITPNPPALSSSLEGAAPPVLVPTRSWKPIHTGVSIAAVLISLAIAVVVRFRPHSELESAPPPIVEVAPVVAVEQKPAQPPAPEKVEATPKPEVKVEAKADGKPDAPLELDLPPLADGEGKKEPEPKKEPEAKKEPAKLDVRAAKVKPAGKRPPAAKQHQLNVEWGRARDQYEWLSRRVPCEAMSMLCNRWDALKADVRAASTEDDIDELLPRLREMQKKIADKKRALAP